MRLSISLGTVNFNPRSHEGSDVTNSVFPFPVMEFQSTLPRRERHTTTVVDVDARNFNPRSREGSDSNFDQKFIPLFDKKSQIIFFEIKFPLSYPLFFPKYSSFVHISGCEFLYDFMSASHSHSHIITKLTYHLLQFHDQHPCAPPLPDTYFLNSRISNCQHSHQ